MATQLYPPYIEGTLPAFYANKSNEDGNMSAVSGTITIPFNLNRAVSKGEIGGVCAKFKTVQNDVLLTSVTAYDYDLDKGEAKFRVSDFVKRDLNNKITDYLLQIGMFYKVQLAFVDVRGNIGYFSTVGTIKCTDTPTVGIEGLVTGSSVLNRSRNTYIGTYMNNDTNEKVYTYRFILKNSKTDEIVFDTGDTLHDSTYDEIESNTSKDVLEFSRDLEAGVIYKMHYAVTTLNGLVYPSDDEGWYSLSRQKTLKPVLDATVNAELNKENGYIDISLKPIKEDVVANGTFILTRQDIMNPNVWEEMCRFPLKYETPDKTIFRDFTIQQGKTYIYGVQQYNKKGVISDRIVSKNIYADFDDMFLFDGKRQLSLKYNPQVSSFKTNIAETKTDMIGNKYPYFFRNARVEYKSFPVSGLLSMNSDEEELFASKEEIMYNNNDNKSRNATINRSIDTKRYSSFDLVSQNIATERLFKLKAEEWLRNGKVKLFRSPTEGNYLIRMMDVSLTPNTQLGRMLHTVTGTAYECAECTYDNMIKFGIISDAANLSGDEDSVVTAVITQYKAVNIDGVKMVGDSIPKDLKDLYAKERQDKIDKEYNEFVKNFNTTGLTQEQIDNTLKQKKTEISSSIPISQAYLHSQNLLTADSDDVTSADSLRLQDMQPGSRIEIVFNSSGKFMLLNELEKPENSDYGIIVTIGATGAYRVDDVGPIYGVYLINPYYDILITGTEVYNYRYIENTDALDAGQRTLKPIVEVLNSAQEELKKQNLDYKIYHNNAEATALFEYKGTVRNSFDSIYDVETDAGTYKQFIGQVGSVIDAVNSRKCSPTYLIMLDVHKRPIKYLYVSGNNSNTYYDALLKKPFNEKTCDKTQLYIIRDLQLDEKYLSKQRIPYDPTVVGQDNKVIANHLGEGYTIDRLHQIDAPTWVMNYEYLEELLNDTQLSEAWHKYLAEMKTTVETIKVYDPSIGYSSIKEGWRYMPKVFYNGEDIDIRETERFTVYGEEIIPAEWSANNYNGDFLHGKLLSTPKIAFGNGVYGELFYQSATVEYACESTDQELIKMKNDLDKAFAAAKTAETVPGALVKQEGQAYPTETEVDIEGAVSSYRKLWDSYNKLLDQKVKNWTSQKGE